MYNIKQVFCLKSLRFFITKKSWKTSKNKMFLNSYPKILVWRQEGKGQLGLRIGMIFSNLLGNNVAIDNIYQFKHSDYGLSRHSQIHRLLLHWNSGFFRMKPILWKWLVVFLSFIQVFCKKDYLKNLAKFTRKTPVLESLFNKVTGLRAVTSLK